MQIKLNGKIINDIQTSICTIDLLLTELKIYPGAVYIRKNGNTIRTSKIEETTIQDKDLIELITLIAGG